MGTKYLVAIGLNYSDKRAEIGDVVDDLPEKAIQDLLALGAITKVATRAKGK